MKFDSQAVHTGERKKPTRFIPVTTPIYTAASYIYEDMDTLDRVLGNELGGPSYIRYNNPTTDALQDVLTKLEGGAGTLVCSSGMTAVQLAIQAAMVDKKRSIVSARALYGATIHLLMKILEPSGVTVTCADFNNLEEVQKLVDQEKPSCLLVETISNPLLRVAELDKIGAIAKAADAALIVDNTFATPMIVRPIELGASMVVHSLTKYLSGHGDMMGGAIISGPEHLPNLLQTARAMGPNLGPFESFLALRGIKTFPLRMERQCQNACKVASWLATHPAVESVVFPGDPKHPDHATVRRLFPSGVYGAVVSFELKGVTSKEGVFKFMNALKMIVPATSVGDVHTMMLYPAISSHRDLSPKHRARLGIKDNLVRLSVGIESVEDITGDLDQAF